MLSTRPTRLVRTAAVAALATLCILAVRAAGASAQSHTLYVSPGQSIQAALDRAHPGDTVRVAPGVYQEHVTISVPDVTLQGAGWRTVITPPPDGTQQPCAGSRLAAGICVARPDLAALGAVRVTDLTVQDASGVGILLAGRTAPVWTTWSLATTARRESTRSAQRRP
jgi:pectin methylesterase-like acyl-CoA thioesterase